MSNKFNCKILSVGTSNGYEFNIEKINITNILINSNELIQLICSSKLIEFIKSNDNNHLVSDIFLKIYAHNSYVLTEAQTQLSDLKKLSGVKYLIGMPYLHEGKIPVGSVCVSDSNNLYPELVGTDIGCGMSSIKTSIKTNSVLNN